MSLKYRDVTGKETPIAGLNGLSGELVPSVSYYQTGVATITETIPANSYKAVDVTFANAMPDKDYCVVFAQHTRANTHSDAWGQTAEGFRVYMYNDTDEDMVPSDARPITVTWRAFKLMTDESRAIDEAAIAQNASDIATLKSSINNVARYELPTSAYNSDVVTTSSAGASTTVQSYGKIRIIEGGGMPFKAVGAKQNVTVLTLPSGYRPKYKAELMAMCTGGTAGAGVLRCWVETSGIVRVWTGDTQCGGYLFISGTYIAAD